MFKAKPRYSRRNNISSAISMFIPISNLTMTLEVFILVSLFSFTALSSSVVAFDQIAPYDGTYNKREHKSGLIDGHKQQRVLQLVFPNCNATMLDYIGDGQCDLISNYNTAACGWDGGDCCEETCNRTSEGGCPLERMECRDPRVLFYPNCSENLLSSVGDGFCDKDGQNSYECGWDGGDCCQESCQPGLWYTCNSTDSPFQCKDPQYILASTSKSPTLRPSTRKPTGSPVSTQRPTRSPLTLQPTRNPTTSAPITSSPTTLTPETPKPTTSPTNSPITSEPTTSPTSTRTTTKPTVPPVTSQPTLSPTQKATSTSPTMWPVTRPTLAGVYGEVPIETQVQPFYLELVLPGSSNVSQLEDINLDEFTSITNSYLNQYLSESTSLNLDVMNFINISLTLDRSGSTVQQQVQQVKRRKLRIEKRQLQDGGNTNTLFRSYFDGLAHWTIPNGSSTNKTFVTYQNELLNNQIASAFSSDQVIEYNTALRKSSDPIIFQMTFASSSFDQPENDHGGDGGGTTTPLALSPAWIAVICAIGAAIFVFAAALFWYRRNQLMRGGKQVKQVLTPTSSPSRPTKNSISPDNKNHQDRPDDENSSEDMEQQTDDEPSQIAAISTESHQAVSPQVKGHLQSKSFDSQNTEDHQLAYTYSVDQFVGPQKQDVEQNYLKGCASDGSASTCTADVVDLMKTIEILDVKVSKLEAEKRRADVTIFRGSRQAISVSPISEQDLVSTDSVEANTGAPLAKDDDVNNIAIHPSSSFEGRGCASAVTNPYTMRGRQIIHRNKSYDSQASVISTPFSVVDMRTRDTVMIRKTEVASPVSTVIHNAYSAPVDTSVLRTISSDVSESTSEHENPSGPPKIHRTKGHAPTLLASDSFEANEFSSTNSVATIKISNSYDKHDLILERVDENGPEIPNNVGINCSNVLIDSPKESNQRRSSNPIFQSMRLLNKLKVSSRNKRQIPPPPIPPPPPPIDSDETSRKSSSQFSSQQQELDAFAILEINGSFEVDEKSCESHPPIHPEDQLCLDRLTAKRRMKSSSMLRHKPTSENAEDALDSYRRFDRRNKRCSVVHEGDNEEESNGAECFQDSIDDSSADESSNSELLEDALSDAAIVTLPDMTAKEITKHPQTDVQQIVRSLPPTSIESSSVHQRPISRASGKHHEEELFDILDRDGSFEVDENIIEYGVTPALGSTKRLSPSEYNNNPFTKLFTDKKRFKGSRAQRPKPTSEEAKPALDPYRRIEMRKKHTMIMEREGHVDAPLSNHELFELEKESKLDENLVCDDTVTLVVAEKEEIDWSIGNTVNTSSTAIDQDIFAANLSDEDDYDECKQCIL